jgi:subtilisin family serine protease
MGKLALVKIMSLGLALILLAACLFSSMPAAAAGPPSLPLTANTKVSSLLSLHVKIKLSQVENSPQGTIKAPVLEPQVIGENTPVNNEQVFLRFSREPSAAQLSELSSSGVTVYPDSWIPPAGNLKTGFVLADMPVDKLDFLASKSYILSLDTAEQSLTPQNDQARAVMNVDPVWQGGDTGAGVTVAVIDSGIDTSNPDFPPLNSYNSKDYSNYPALDDTITNTVTGHGTHVTGSLLGRGVNSATYKGVAPGAGLVFLKVGDDITGSASSAAVAYAIRDAVDIYHAKIINLSYGGWSQYHDGTDQESQSVDYATSQGATVFVAAGNYASEGWHYSGTVAANSTTTDIPITIAAGETSYLAENLVWFDNPGVHNGLALQYFNSGYVQLFPNNGGQSESARGTESSYYSFDTSLASGTYYLRVQNSSSNNQLFHLYYMGGSKSVQFSSSDPNYTVNSPAEADSAIAVGAYVDRGAWYNYQGSQVSSGESEETIATFSARGPRVDEGAPEKPELVAPGSAVISVRDPLYVPNTVNNPLIIDDNGLHQNNDATSHYFVMQGTSMASPIAAGVGTLLLSKNPGLTPAEVKHALETTAAGVGGNWNNIWGFGIVKADASANWTNFLLNTYSDEIHAIPCTDFNRYSTEHTVYVFSPYTLGSKTYNVTYYDGSNTQVDNSLVAGSFSFADQHTFTGETEIAGTWHIIVSEQQYLPPASYDSSYPYGIFSATIVVQPSAMGPGFPEVTTNGASNITTAGAKLNATLNSMGGAANVTLSFEYGLTAGYGFNVSGNPANLTNTGDFSAEISGLSTGQTYHFRTRVQTNAGMVAFGADMTFSTWTVALGGIIAFSSDRGFQKNVFLMNADGTQVTQITDGLTQGSYSASFSPDGSKVAYLIPSQIIVMNIDGSDGRTLINGDIRSAPAWSPDGTRIVFIERIQNNNGAMSVISTIKTDGSEYRQLSNEMLDQPGNSPADPDWSPDGTKIAFSAITSSDGFQIFVMNADGTDLTRITGSAYMHSQSPAWSPDGSKLAYSVLSGADIHIINSDGTGERNLTNDGILYPPTAPPVIDLNPIWSPDGTKILFTSQRGQNRFYQMYVINIDGTNLTRLSENDYEDYADSWAAGTWAGPSVSTGAASTIPGASVTLNGNLIDKGNATSVSVSFDWGTDTAYGNNIAGIPSTLSANGPFTANLAGLYVGQTYHYRAKAVGGGIVYGNDRTFSLDSFKLAVITSPQIVSAGAASAIVTVQTQDLSGNPANFAAATDVDLASTSDSGRFDTSATGPFNGSVTKVTIPAGNNQANFYYKDTKTGSPTITASNTGYASGSQQETIVAASPLALNLATPPVIGVSVDADFTTQPVVLVSDEFGNPVDGINVTVSRGNGTGLLRGSLVATSAAGTGLAAFTNLGYNKSGETFSLHFAAASIILNSSPLGPLNVGNATQVGVETAANGSGTIVPAQNLTVGLALTTYGVTRDQFGNYLTNPADTNWSLTSKTGGIVNSDLSAGVGASITFTARQAGTAIIHAVNGSLTAGDSGVISVTAPVPPPVGGGGGGGGGFFGGGGGGSIPQPTLAPGQNDISEKSAPDGTFYVNTQAVSSDKLALVFIDANNKGQTLAGGKLSAITILPDSNPPAPSNSQNLISAYDFSPSGATFAKPVTITLKYDPTSPTVGTDTTRLYVACWDSYTRTWLALSSMVVIADNSVKVSVYHFSLYALMAPKAIAPTPTPAAEPSLPSTPPPTFTPTPTLAPGSTAVATPPPAMTAGAQPTTSLVPTPGISPTSVEISPLTEVQAPTSQNDATPTSQIASNSKVPFIVGIILSLGLLVVAGLITMLLGRRKNK